MLSRTFMRLFLAVCIAMPLMYMVTACGNHTAASTPGECETCPTPNPSPNPQPVDPNPNPVPPNPEPDPNPDPIPPEPDPDPDPAPTFGRMTSFSVTIDGVTTPLIDCNYDDEGQLIELIAHDPPQSWQDANLPFHAFEERFTYDEESRLIEQEHTYFTRRFTYDAQERISTIIKEFPDGDIDTTTIDYTIRGWSDLRIDLPNGDWLSRYPSGNWSLISWDSYPYNEKHYGIHSDMEVVFNKDIQTGDTVSTYRADFRTPVEGLIVDVEMTLSQLQNGIVTNDLRYAYEFFHHDDPDGFHPKQTDYFVDVNGFPGDDQVDFELNSSFLYAYDAEGNLITIERILPDGTVMMTYEFSYEALGPTPEPSLSERDYNLFIGPFDRHTFFNADTTRYKWLQVQSMLLLNTLPFVTF